MVTLDKYHLYVCQYPANQYCTCFFRSDVLHHHHSMLQPVCCFFSVDSTATFKVGDYKQKLSLNHYISIITCLQKIDLLLRSFFIDSMPICLINKENRLNTGDLL